MSLAYNELFDQVRARRLQQSIPSSYTIWKDGSTYYAETNIAGKTDYSGSDAATVIQSAVTALKLTGTDRVYCNGEIILKDILPITTPLNLTSIQGLKLKGTGGLYGKQGQLLFNLDTIGIDLTDSAYCSFEDVTFWTGTGYTPKTHVLMARDTNVRSSGEHTFSRCSFYGDASSALVYNYGSEINSFMNCSFGSKRRAMTITRNNIDSLTSSFKTISAGAQSTSINNFVSCAFNRAGLVGLTGEGILLEACWGTTFEACYLSNDASGLPVITVDDSGHTSLLNCRTEATPVLSCGVNDGSSGIFLTDWGMAGGTGQVIDLNAAGSVHYGVHIRNIIPNYGIAYSLAFNDLVGSEIDLRHGFTEIPSAVSLAVNNLNDSKIITDQSSLFTMTGTLTNSEVKFLDGPIIEHHTADDTLKNYESGTIHTNLGAGADITLTLPQVAGAGVTFEFVVMTPVNKLQIEAGAAGAIYINGVKTADDVYIWADDEGVSVKLIADGNGDWVALYTQGTWTVV